MVTKKRLTRSDRPPIFSSGHCSLFPSAAFGKPTQPSFFFCTQQIYQKMTQLTHLSDSWIFLTKRTEESHFFLLIPAPTQRWSSKFMGLSWRILSYFTWCRHIGGKMNMNFALFLQRERLKPSPAFVWQYPQPGSRLCKRIGFDRFRFDMTQFANNQIARKLGMDLDVLASGTSWGSQTTSTFDLGFSKYY